MGMVREVRRHGLKKGIRVWFTWASVDDIETLTKRTRASRWVWANVLRQGSA